MDARRVLAFGAHPDDLEVGAGGLIARCVRDGATVTMVVSSIPNRFPERLDEARAGAKILGGQLVFALGEREVRVDEVPMHQLVARFDELVAEYEPDLVITHNASDLHADHYRVHRATISAVRRAPCDLLAYTAAPDLSAQRRTYGDCFVDITDTIDTKLESVTAHASQISTRTIESRRDMARAIGRVCGLHYAEAYEVLRLRI